MPLKNLVKSIIARMHVFLSQSEKSQVLFCNQERGSINTDLQKRDIDYYFAGVICGAD